MAAEATRSRRWLLHPLLMGLYFVLTLAASNATAMNGWRDLVWPASISLVVSSLCWAIGFALTRDGQKAAWVKRAPETAAHMVLAAIVLFMMIGLLVGRFMTGPMGA